MSEGEWPPPTTFTLLFCCRARASTCQDNVSQDLLREEARGPSGAGVVCSGWEEVEEREPLALVDLAWFQRAREMGSEVSWD